MNANNLTPFMAFWLGLNVAAKAAGEKEWKFYDARTVWLQTDTALQQYPSPDNHILPIEDKDLPKAKRRY